MEKCPDLLETVRSEVFVDQFANEVSGLVVPDVVPASIYIASPQGYSLSFTGIKGLSGILVGGSLESLVRSAAAGATVMDSTALTALNIPVAFDSAAQIRANDGTHITMGQVFRYQDEVLLGFVLLIVVYLVIIARLRIRPGIFKVIAIPLVVFIILVLVYIFGFNRRIDLSNGLYFTMSGSISFQLTCAGTTPPTFDAEQSSMETSSDFGVKLFMDSTAADLSFITSLAQPVIQKAIQDLGTNFVRTIVVPAVNKQLIGAMRSSV